MVRNLMLSVGFFALTAGSAFAAPKAHVARTHQVAQAPAADAPAGGATDTAKDKKATPKKGHKSGKKAKAEGETKGSETTPAPAPTPAPAK